MFTGPHHRHISKVRIPELLCAPIPDYLFQITTLTSSSTTRFRTHTGRPLPFFLITKKAAALTPIEPTDYPITDYRLPFPCLFIISFQFVNTMPSFLKKFVSSGSENILASHTRCCHELVIVFRFSVSTEG